MTPVTHGNYDKSKLTTMPFNSYFSPPPPDRHILQLSLCSFVQARGKEERHHDAILTRANCVTATFLSLCIVKYWREIELLEPAQLIA